MLENYIINKPVLYNNIQYTDFIKEFFKSYFDTEKPYTYSELILAINNSDTDVLTNLLSQTESLESDNRVREITEMLLFERNYYNRDVKKERVILKLNNIVSNSKYNENRIIASYYIVKLQKMQKGSLAPEVNLIDYDGDTISLKKYRGKFVLLSFVSQDCKICNFQMQLLNDIRKQFGDDFEIVTIVAGNNNEDISAFAKQRG